jgi:TolB-like protein/Tfp pilus assembly protein PilF
MPTSETTVSKERPSSIATKIQQEFSHWPAILILAILLILVGFVIYNQVIKTGPPQQISSTGIEWKNSVAVLVFKDLSPQGDKEPFCIGVTEAIIRSLHKFQELRVIPLTTVLAYRNEIIDVEEMGKRFNVLTVLDGTLLMEGDNLRITTQLSSVEDGSVLWTDSFNRKRTGELELQDDISKSIAKALGLQLVEERYSVVKKRESTDLKANEHYKYGRYYELRYYDNDEKEDFDSCVFYYTEAVKRDPNFALAYFRLGMVHYSWYVHQNDEQSLNLMYDYYTKAYELDRNLAEVNIGLGWYYFQKEDIDRAYQFFKKAIELDPNNAEISFYVGSFMRSIGLFEQAIKHYSRAFEIDPIPQDFADWQIVRARCYSFSGRFEEAAGYLVRALDMKPSYRLHFGYAFQLIMMKKYEEAETQIAHAAKYDPPDAVLNLYWAWLFAVRGEKKKSLDLIPDEFNPILYHITNTYALLGMVDEAISKIQEGIETGFEEYEEYLYPYTYLVSNPFFDILRDDPRFEEILRKEKLKYEEKLKKYGDL